MIVKTKEFDRRFNQDLYWIEINRRLPLQDKGSYKIKEWGDIVTDIDLQARVYFSPKLIDIISSVLYKNRGNRSPFTFVHLTVGMCKGFELPWGIDDNGGCDYDPKRAMVWYNNFTNSKLVPSYILNYIQEKLFSDNMKIRNLIDIENALQPYSEIVWSEDDIRRGFVDIRDNRYYLLDAMKTETPVLEYVYYYQGKYVAIDVGLVDKKFAVPPSGEMYRYYMDDWYKVMKTFRWKLTEGDRVNYFQTMNTITQMIAMKYQIGFIEKLGKEKVLHPRDFDTLLYSMYKQLDQMGINHKGIKLSEICNYLYEQVNDTLKSSVLFYANKLDSVAKEKILQRLERGVESQIPSTQEQLVARRKVGIQCPFFPTDLDEYDKLTELSIRLDMDVDKVVDCFFKVATEMNNSISQVIKDVVQTNTFSIMTMGSEVVLNEDGQEKGRYPIGDKKKLQAYILLKRI
jgi:hypothetical protein